MTFRPGRFIYGVILTLLAYYYTGWVGVALVIAAQADLEVK